MSRSCPSCGLPAASPRDTTCARCGAHLPPPPGQEGAPTDPSPGGAAPPAVPPPGAPTDARSGLPGDVRNWAMAAHLAAFSAFVFPLGFVVGPLVVWLIKRDEHPFIAAHGRAAMNFNLSVLIYGIVSFVLVFLIVGILLLVALVGVWIAFTIVAAIRAANGEAYDYPFTIRFIS